MAQQKKVIDASVIVKWFLPEAGSDHAIELREQHIHGTLLLVVPDLAFIEVLNSLRYNRYHREQLIQANKRLWELQLHIERMNTILLEKAAALALQYNLSMYDAIYAALAHQFDIPLITADKELAKVPGAIVLGKL